MLIGCKHFVALVRQPALAKERRQIFSPNRALLKFGVTARSPTFNQRIDMPLHRNFTYWIDKRKWKYYFLMVSLELVRKPERRKGRKTIQ